MLGKQPWQKRSVIVSGLPSILSLNDIGPYHQASLADKLDIKLTFNDSKAVILGSTPTLAGAADSDYDYSVTDIRTEWNQTVSYTHLTLPTIYSV